MSITRRDFLKLSSLVTASSILGPGLHLLPNRPSSDSNAKNVVIIVFDTLSGSHLNFLGYPRETMPNLTRLLERGTVYHNHYASSNFTTPGTASLLTGQQVWKHLAFKLNDSVTASLSNQNIFSFFDDYYSIAYSHNYYTDALLSQFQAGIDQHEFLLSQFLAFQQSSTTPWFENLMKNDYDTAALFRSRLEDTKLDGYLYSLLFPSLIDSKPYQPPEDLMDEFPRGLPAVKDDQDPFVLETVIDWCAQRVPELPQPFLGYFHLLPPHYPYNTRRDFIDAFLEDGFLPPDKPLDPFALKDNIYTRQQELIFRQDYDEFILYVDSEFGRLFSMLEAQGVLDNTLLVLTTDHGELIERGMRGHGLTYLFEPLVKVPLVIFEPGQTQRRDIHTLTSAVDLVPTLLHYTGHDLPPGLPGQILPPFEGAAPDPERKVYALFAKDNKGFSHVQTATLMMRSGKWKVIRYAGYPTLNRFRIRAGQLNDTRDYPDPYFLVFDLENDPEELDNLAERPTPEVQALIDNLELYFRENVEYPDTSAK